MRFVTRSLAARLALALGSILLVAVVLEIGLRLGSGRMLEPPRPARDSLQIAAFGLPFGYDRELGFAPTPGAAAPASLWGEVNITPAGVRSNGAAARPPGRPIVAVGDSFTFGDEVQDSETWPAQLERSTGLPVLNGGVSGYGLDQMLLRAERLLDRHPARLLIVSLIDDSVRRCEFSYRFAWKPYFELDGGLQLRNVPVPGPEVIPVSDDLLIRSLGWSHAAAFVGGRLDPDGWILPESIRVMEDAAPVANALIDRLDALARERGVELLLVLQWHPFHDTRVTRPLMHHARSRGIQLLRAYSDLAAAVPSTSEDTPSWEHFFRPSGHMNPAGNAELARIIARRLDASGGLSEPPSDPQR